MINNKIKTKQFLTNLFSKVLENPDKYPDQSIELSIKSNRMNKWWFKSIDEAIDYAEKQDAQHYEVYFTVNPLPFNKSKKEDIEYIVTFHLDVDYGKEGHKKKSKYKTKEEALKAINKFPIPPTMIVHSGNGFHCYWILEEPIKISNNDDIKIIEDIDKLLITQLGGDKGTHNINRILRLPGTHNYKNHDDIKDVTLEKDDGPYCNIEDFDVLKSTTEAEGTTDSFDDDTDTYEDIQSDFFSSEDDIKIEDYDISSDTKNLIENGGIGKYKSRSEADFAVTLSLIGNGLDFFDIEKVFKNYKIGAKYRDEANPSRYLKTTYQNAKRKFQKAKSKGLSPIDMNDPLIVYGAVKKDKNNEKYLDPYKFSIYATKQLHLKYSANDQTYYVYKDNRFQVIDKNKLCILFNNMLEKHGHEELLTDPILKSTFRYLKNKGIFHFVNNIDYVVFNNCLFNLNTGKPEPFNSKIFCQTYLPYNYDSNATCNGWMKFLNEIFPGDKEKIDLVQELIGYIFHYAMPVPSMNLLIGDGANGKSVFIDTSSSLIDKNFVSHIGFHKLRDDRYIGDLVGKALNVTFENEVSYDNKLDISGTIKSVVAGEEVKANPKYIAHFDFKPFAKHFFAMNNAPKILDKSFGMWRRINIIDFDVRFNPKDQDVHLSDKLKQELPGIFNWAYEGYKRLKANKFRFSKCKTVEENRIIYGQYRKPRTVDQFIRLFLVEKTVRVRNGEIPLKDLYDELISFASKQKFKIERGKGKSYFKAYLENRNFEIKNGNGNTVCIYGISLKL